MYNITSVSDGLAIANAAFCLPTTISEALAIFGDKAITGDMLKTFSEDVLGIVTGEINRYIETYYNSILSEVGETVNAYLTVLNQINQLVGNIQQIYNFIKTLPQRAEAFLQAFYEQQGCEGSLQSVLKCLLCNNTSIADNTLFQQFVNGGYSGADSNILGLEAINQYAYQISNQISKVQSYTSLMYGIV